MKIAKVVGVTICTVKEPRLEAANCSWSVMQIIQARSLVNLTLPKILLALDRKNWSLLWKEVQRAWLRGISTNRLMRRL